MRLMTEGVKVAAALAAALFMHACATVKSEAEELKAKAKEARATENGKAAEAKTKAALTGQKASPAPAKAGAAPAKKEADPALGSCKDEAKKLCESVQHDLRKAVTCLEQNREKLKPACKSEIDKLKALHL